MDIVAFVEQTHTHTGMKEDFKIKKKKQNTVFNE